MALPPAGVGWWNLTTLVGGDVIRLVGKADMLGVPSTGQTVFNLGQEGLH